MTNPAIGTQMTYCHHGEDGIARTLHAHVTHVEPDGRVHLQVNHEEGYVLFGTTTAKLADPKVNEHKITDGYYWPR